MVNEDFIKEYIQLAGQNYGYNIETSTSRQLTEAEIDLIYKGLFEEYGIDNIIFSSYFCETCKGHDETEPYHLDYENLLDLTKEENMKSINKEAWGKERIQEVISGIQFVREKINGLKKNKNADLKKEAYIFYNLLQRVVNGQEGQNNFVFVEKKYFESIYSLGEKKVNDLIDEWRARLDIVDKLENERKYQLHVM